MKWLIGLFKSVLSHKGAIKDVSKQDKCGQGGNDLGRYIYAMGLPTIEETIDFLDPYLRQE